MSYNKLLYLQRVKEMNEVYLFYKNKGYSNEEIYKFYIAKRFFISRSTFYFYLTIPYKREFEKILKEKQFKKENANDMQEIKQNAAKIK